MGKWLLVITIIAVGVFFIKKEKPASDFASFPKSQMNERTPVADVEKDERVRVVLFTGTEWCPACQHLEKTVIKTAEWKVFAANEILFKVFDFPSDTSGVPDSVLDAVEAYEIEAYPTMLVLGPDNEVLSRQVGAGAPVENYKAWIREHVAYYDQKKAEALASQSPDATSMLE